MNWASRLIAGKDLRLRIRDRSAFIMGIIAPLALALIFNLTFGEALQPGGIELVHGLVDLDGSQTSRNLERALDGLASEGFLELEHFGSSEAASTAVESGEVQAVIVIPSGFEESLGRGSPRLEVVGDIDNQTSTAVAAAIARQFGAELDSVRLGVVSAASLLGVPPTPDFVGDHGVDPAIATSTASVADVGAETRQLDPTTYLAAGMAVFFLFFTVQSGVIGLLEEERDGTLQRLFAAPVARHAVVGGKALMSLVLGVFALGVLVVATSLLMGASWGNPFGVALLVVTAVLAAVSLMGLVAGVAHTPEGAENMASIVAVILGMLGGVFFPIGTGEGLLSLVTMATPHHWFLRGLGDLAGGASWTAALPAAGVLVGIAIVLGAVAWWVLGRRFSE